MATKLEYKREECHSSIFRRAKDKADDLIQRYSQAGWRLHTMTASPHGDKYELLFERQVSA